MARTFRILYDAAAGEDLRVLRAYDVRRIMNAVDRHLSRDPMTEGPRKKLLRGLVAPWNELRPIWQLRIGDFRVFYDVDEAREEVIVRAVRRKGTKTTGEIL